MRATCAENCRGVLHPNRSTKNRAEVPVKISRARWETSNSICCLHSRNHCQRRSGKNETEMGSGENFQERSKGKDVRTSNIVAAKVSAVMSDRFAVPRKHPQFHVSALFHLSMLTFCILFLSSYSVGHRQCRQNVPRTTRNGQTSSA